MSRVLITGSADGLGLSAAQLLLSQGHAVVLHARNESRAGDVRAKLAEAEVVVGDLENLDGMRRVADQANALGRFDAVIHNAGIGSQGERRLTADGLERTFAVNTLAPYVLTHLIQLPSSLVYLSSGLHNNGRGDLADPQFERRAWSGSQAYADSKLFVVALAFAFARRWPEVRSNAVDPGWVATRMGGPSGSNDFVLGSATQAWLAVSDDPGAAVTGGYFRHQARAACHPAASDTDLQQQLLAYCADLSGTK